MEYGFEVCGLAAMLGFVGVWAAEVTSGKPAIRFLRRACPILLCLLGFVYYVVVDARWPATLPFLASAAVQVVLAFVADSLAARRREKSPPADAVADGAASGNL